MGWRHLKIPVKIRPQRETPDTVSNPLKLDLHGHRGRGGRRTLLFFLLILGRLLLASFNLFFLKLLILPLFILRFLIGRFLFGDKADTVDLDLVRNGFGKEDQCLPIRSEHRMIVIRGPDEESYRFFLLHIIEMDIPIEILFLVGIGHPPAVGRPTIIIDHGHRVMGNRRQFPGIDIQQVKIMIVRMK